MTWALVGGDPVSLVHVVGDAQVVVGEQ